MSLTLSRCDGVGQLPSMWVGGCEGGYGPMPLPGWSYVTCVCVFQVDEGMQVAYGLCEQLDDMKLTYQALPDTLTRVGFTV